eukprot:5730281-Amphidinium_carterae.3
MVVRIPCWHCRVPPPHRRMQLLRLLLRLPDATSVAPLSDATVTRRDLDFFGERLLNMVAQKIKESIVPRFDDFESRISELEKRGL